MSGIKAEWRLAELLLDDGNPFDKVILSSGLKVDLSGTEDEIFVGLQRSLTMEGDLFDRGITCELKDGGQDCLDCPMYVADRAEESRAPLCRLGRDQRLLEARCQELSGARRALAFQPLSDLVDSMEPFSLRPEDEELLTAAGF